MMTPRRPGLRKRDAVVEDFARRLRVGARAEFANATPAVVARNARRVRRERNTTAILT